MRSPSPPSARIDGPLTGLLSLAALTTAWGVVMAVSPALQIRRIRETGSSLGVSAVQVAVIFVGNGLWLAYGLSTDVAPLIIVNVIALLANGVWLVHVLRYRPAADASEPGDVARQAPDEPTEDEADASRVGAGVG